jgi:hypothetical protein
MEPAISRSICAGRSRAQFGDFSKLKAVMSATVPGFGAGRYYGNAV